MYSSFSLLTITTLCLCGIIAKPIGVPRSLALPSSTNGHTLVKRGRKEDAATYEAQRAARAAVVAERKEYLKKSAKTIKSASRDMRRLTAEIEEQEYASSRSSSSSPVQVNEDPARELTKEEIEKAEKKRLKRRGKRLIVKKNRQLDKIAEEYQVLFDGLNIAGPSIQEMRVAYANSKSSINQAKVDNMALMERYEASINEMKEFEEKRVTLHKDYDNLTVVINTCIQKLIESEASPNSLRIQFNFRFDKDSGQTSVTLVNRGSDDIITMTKIKDKMAQSLELSNLLKQVSLVHVVSIDITRQIAVITEAQRVYMDEGIAIASLVGHLEKQGRILKTKLEGSIESFKVDHERMTELRSLGKTLSQEVVELKAQTIDE